MDYEMSLDSSKRKFGFIDKIKGVLSVTISYFIVHSLSLFKIGKLIKVAKHICIKEISIEEANAIWEVVRQSSFFFPARVACLETSLAFVLFALTKRLFVSWCVGVKIQPFEAHAWIEIDGKPFRESETIEQEFKKLFVA